MPITRIPIKGGMNIPNIATFDHGTFGYVSCLGRLVLLLFFLTKAPLVFDLRFVATILLEVCVQGKFTCFFFSNTFSLGSITL